MIRKFNLRLKKIGFFLEKRPLKLQPNMKHLLFRTLPPQYGSEKYPTRPIV